MAFMLYSIENAVDSKYIVIKSLKGQTKKGSLIHVMDARETSDGITVYYRINKTKQDYIVRFKNVNQFCKWCMPSTFLAKYYNKLSYSDVMRYIRVENRSFISFYLPLILLCLAAIWLVSWFVVKDLMGMMITLIIGGALSVVAIIAIFLIQHIVKSQMTERLYRKVS